MAEDWQRTVTVEEGNKVLKRITEAEARVYEHLNTLGEMHNALKEAMAEMLTHVTELTKRVQVLEQEADGEDAGDE